MRQYSIAYQRRWARIASAAAMSTIIAACSSGSTSPPADSVAGKLIRGTAEPAQISPESGESGKRLKCPRVSIREGTQVVRVYERGGEDDPTQVRYQATISETARECFFSGGILTMKVGVAGWIVAGPKGAVGNINVPLRIAIVQGGSEVLFSKLYQIPATLSATQPRVSFTHVDDAIYVPEPERNGSYRVFVGFDEKR